MHKHTAHSIRKLLQQWKYSLHTGLQGQLHGSWIHRRCFEGMSHFTATSSTSAQTAADECEQGATGGGIGIGGFIKGIMNGISGRPVPGTVKAVKTTSATGAESSAANGLLGVGMPPLKMTDKLPSTPASSSSATSASSSIDRQLSAAKYANELVKQPQSPDIRTSFERVQQPYRIQQFDKLLQADNIDLNALRILSWSGIPTGFRTMVWQLLVGYMPTNKARREQAIFKKRKEYFDSIPQHFDVPDEDKGTNEQQIKHQITVDLPRTSPSIPFFQQTPIQKALERILYIWSIRHPASGYVQGMNDLLTPMLCVCMSPFIDGDVLRSDVTTVDTQTLMNVEADAYWMFSKLLDNIQDHYTSSQPGLQRMVLRLEDLVHRIDNELHEHFETEGLQYIQFGFRWMNCLLLREIPLRAIIRIWDTYLSEDRGGFENFHVYVCAVLLKTYKLKLLEMSFQDLIMFLQDMPTMDWSEEDVEPILSQAFILSTLFEDSPSHLG